MILLRITLFVRFQEVPGALKDHRCYPKNLRTIFSIRLQNQQYQQFIFLELLLGQGRNILTQPPGGRGRGCNAAWRGHRHHSGHVRSEDHAPCPRSGEDGGSSSDLEGSNIQSCLIIQMWVMNMKSTQITSKDQNQTICMISKKHSYSCVTWRLGRCYVLGLSAFEVGSLYMLVNQTKSPDCIGCIHKALRVIQMAISWSFGRGEDLGVPWPAKELATWTRTATCCRRKVERKRGRVAVLKGGDNCEDGIDSELNHQCCGSRSLCRFTVNNWMNLMHSSPSQGFWKKSR